MKNLVLRFSYDKNKRASATKPQPLYIEVRVKGTNKAVYIPVGYKLYPNQFSDRKGFTCKNHKRAPIITKEAHALFDEIEEFALSDRCTTLDDVKNYQENQISEESVTEFMERELRESNPTISVLDHHRSLIRRIADYGKLNTFQDLTYQNIDGLDKHLRKTISSQQVLYKRHMVLSKYIDKAIKMGLCEKNPYDEYKVSKGTALKPVVFLTEEELRQIENYRPIDAKLERVRKLFIFQCYTGMAYVDLENFQKDWISEMDGYKVIRSNRVKTSESFVTILFPEAQKILEEFDYNLPVISNQKYNDYLKLIKAALGLRKRLTTHVARHTFATMLINKGVPLESVSKAMGHSSMRQTTHYAQLLGKTVVNDLAKLL